MKKFTTSKNRSVSFSKGYEATRDECLNILFEIENDFWGDRSRYNVIMRAQMDFAKRIRQRIAILKPNNVTLQVIKADETG